MQPSYFISTKSCVVPHVVDPQSIPSTNKNVKIYIDDILYKDSAYEGGFDLEINEFCSFSSIKTCLGFRNRPKTLVSKRGHYKLKKERYEELLGVLKPDYHADFDTGKIFVEGNELIEPKDVGEFVELLNGGHLLFGTEFVNNLVNQGMMMRFDGCKIDVCRIFDCKCCGDLSPGYLEYLWNIKEMNALTYLAIHNYNVLDEIFKATSLNKLSCGDVKVGDRV
ncbi:hypothetical protein KMI_09g14990 [Encephalitozoon hellem]|nr:hypothetical protein KMI_09g14990 [Encephalitozoon hellem]